MKHLALTLVFTQAKAIVTPLRVVQGKKDPRVGGRSQKEVPADVAARQVRRSNAQDLKFVGRLSRSTR
ncbi:MAG: hypothetical protein ABI356_02785 [Steroidobacteraceae bacterium]